jgi:hypothetical protein
VRARRAADELAPETIELIAQRVAELLRPRETHDLDAHPRRLLDAGELAGRLGVSREWVYEHANELGAVRLGDGPRARLRFDPNDAARVLDARRRATPPDASTAALEPRPGRPRRRAPAGAPLLPIYEPGTRRIITRARFILSRQERC